MGKSYGTQPECTDLILFFFHDRPQYMRDITTDRTAGIMGYPVYATGKSGLVAWLVSNFESKSGRERFVAGTLVTDF